jgi:hypothetical protein
MTHLVPRVSLLPVFVLAAAAFVPTTVVAQFGETSPPNDLDRAEDTNRMGDYETGNLHLPGTRDPFDDTAFFEVGFFRRTSDVFGDSVSSTAVPMRFGLDMPFGPHWQASARFAVAGHATSAADPIGGGTERTRTFRPGNLALGSYYARGGDGSVLWTVGAGGQLVLPTAQYDVDTGGEFAAVVSSASVHGFEDLWLYAPKTLSFVPGGYARMALGKLFVNGRLDLGIMVPTDGGDANAHTFQMRVEAGYRGGESLRLGVGYTNVVLWGAGYSGADRSQSALRLFVRADIKILTVGCEFVMNLDDPIGFAFDDGIWGLVSTIGISL